MAFFQNLGRLIVVAGGLALLSGGGGGGADATTEMDVRTTTQGQELLDLKSALDAGAISQKEYDKQRQKILDRE